MRGMFGSTLLLLVVGLSSCGKMQPLTSPDKSIQVVLSIGEDEGQEDFGKVSFKVRYKSESDYIDALPESPLGIIRSDASFVNNLTFTGASAPVEVQDEYVLLTGKKSQIRSTANEQVFSYRNADGRPLDIVFRVYNDGVAFRYRFPGESDSLVNITGEATAFHLPDSTTRWMQPYFFAYEDFYEKSQTGQSPKKEQEWGFPALYQVNNQPVWVLISEANNTRENCATRLSNLENRNIYKVMYPPARDGQPVSGVQASLPWSSQWYVLTIGSLSDVVESTLTTDVSDPNQLEDVSWIQPGPVSWIYWANNRGSKDFQKVVEYVDLAVEMGWPYVLIDWEWDVMTNGGDIFDALKYAKSKGVKTMIWYNSGTSWLDPTPNDRLLTPEARAKEFAWLNEIGVYGIKVDFFAGDQQDMMQYYLDILEEAADYRLLVNFHGATVPRGWSRTYPNMMTSEAVYGAEWYNNLPVLTNRAAEHNTVLPFTRNVIGSMDYTPVTFSNSQHPHITSYGHELALSVVFESGLQHFADRPEAYYALPEAPKAFLKTVPVTWDDTRLVDGYPGKQVVMARRKGTEWYVGGLNGTNESQTLTLDLAFLEAGNYSLALIKDGADDQSFASDTLDVTSAAKIKIECLPRGGFAGRLTRSN